MPGMIQDIPSDIAGGLGHLSAPSIAIFVICTVVAGLARCINSLRNNFYNDAKDVSSAWEQGVQEAPEAEEPKVEELKTAAICGPAPCSSSDPSTLCHGVDTPSTQLPKLESPVPSIATRECPTLVPSEDHSALTPTPKLRVRFAPSRSIEIISPYPNLAESNEVSADDRPGSAAGGFDADDDDDDVGYKLMYLQSKRALRVASGSLHVLKREKAKSDVKLVQAQTRNTELEGENERLKGGNENLESDNRKLHEALVSAAGGLETAEKTDTILRRVNRTLRKESEDAKTLSVRQERTNAGLVQAIRARDAETERLRTERLRLDEEYTYAKFQAERQERINVDLVRQLRVRDAEIEHLKAERVAK
ncbi:unnamed protein product [Peniophora sp. CBMAI 1063]|nr:unnamed protein product [Peniophora sp. CBMAI 1063]